ncbi:EpsG family protein [Butyrivibrio fibrisolvens]|uniref:EpsG family protein n=1 Tax=Butyrivibrio fibrisolvens TaxID=831 RepID=A0A317G3D4_BUTFI|nr:EpsG family protein [Butyrivibrio fibrisolvens]PWT26930.1 hypothetical protein CPT75_07350 [Butyrivibrio fibrisolvens]
MVYFVSFFVAILLMRMSEKAVKKKKKVLLFLSSGLVLVMLAAFRDITVGYDVRVYQWPLFTIARSSQSIYEYMNKALVLVEPFYALVTFFSAQFGEKMFWAFFFNESIIIAFTLASLYYFRKVVPVYLSLSCFCFTYYLRGYDQTRQFIAVSIVMLAVALIVNGKKIIPFILVFIAMGFHYTAIVGIGIILVYMTLNGVLKRVIVFLWFVSGVVVIIYYKDILKYVLKRFPLRAERYLKMLMMNQKYDNVHYIGFLYFTFAVIILLLKIYLVEENKNTIYLFLLCLMFLGIAGAFIQNLAGPVQRIFIYSDIFVIFVIPLIPNMIKTDKIGKILVWGMTYLIMIAYWFVVYVNGNAGAVYPYVFAK